MADEREKQLLQDLLASEAWNQFLVKYLLKFKENDIMQLSMLRKEGSGPPDNYLRGRMDVYNFLLFGLAKQLDEWNNPETDVTNPREPDSSLPGTGDPYSESTSQGEFE